LATFRQDVEATIPALRRYARALTRDADTADDLVQDTLVRALRSEHLFHGGDVRSWLYTILTNLNRNRLRSLARRPPLSSLDDNDAPDLAGPEAGGDMRLVRRLVFRKTRVAIDAVDRVLRAHEELGRDRAHIDGQSFDDRDHRLTDRRFVLVAARVEPVAPVVSLEPPQKRERREAETRGGLHIDVVILRPCDLVITNSLRQAFAAAAWKRAIRACASRVRCGTTPIIRCISIS